MSDDPLDQLIHAGESTPARRIPNGRPVARVRARVDVNIRPKSRLLNVVLILLAVSLGLGILTTVGLLVLGGAGVVAIRNSIGEAHEQDARDEPRVREARAARFFPATGIASVYRENEVRGNEEYMGKVTPVTGVVRSIGAEADGRAYVVLDGSVVCTFQNSEKSTIAGLKLGDRINVIGIGEGARLTGVFFKHCVIR